jgi:ABC-type Na+ efflux pump permease subunit
VLAAVSAVCTLNLVFYGVASDDGRFTPPHMLTVVDTTLLLALFGCVTLFWFAAVLVRECRSARTAAEYA